jgi:hypothetical protein
LTQGDITATTVWQAALPPPFQQVPSDPQTAAAVQQGETLFTQIGCAECYRPALTLDNPVFQEPALDPNYRQTGPFADLIPPTPVRAHLRGASHRAPLQRFEAPQYGHFILYKEHREGTSGATIRGAGKRTGKPHNLYHREALGGG